MKWRDLTDETKNILEMVDPPYGSKRTITLPKRCKDGVKYIHSIEGKSWLTIEGEDADSFKVKEVNQAFDIDSKFPIAASNQPSKCRLIRGEQFENMTACEFCFKNDWVDSKRPIYCTLSSHAEGIDNMFVKTNNDERFRKLWFQFKKYITTKNSHGKNELLTQMTDLEVVEFAEDHANGISWPIDNCRKKDNNG